MRSYLDIIIDLKDGLKPDYEEVRLACLMANYLLFFAEKDIERIFSRGSNNNDLQLKLLESSYNSRIKSRNLTPEKYLGNHHPDHPEAKASMEMSKKIYEGFLEHQKKRGDNQ